MLFTFNSFLVLFGVKKPTVSSWLVTDIENRTRKGLLPADFESTASTSSAMSAITVRF